MINDQRLLELRRRAHTVAQRMSDTERTALAEVAVTLHLTRRATLADQEHFREGLRILDGVAPTMSAEFRRLIDATEIIMERINPT